MIYDDQTSSAMNYYEELGVSQEATELEIRKAHRRLVKLMHPDAQPDQNMKMLAETQMRRLNSIVSTLLDPTQRRSYDEELHAAAHMPFRHATSTGRLSWRGIPWWLASSVGAVVLTLVAVWLWADHLGSSFGNKANGTLYIAPPENTSVATLPSAPSFRDPERTKPLGASYTPPMPSQTPQSISDQPKSPNPRVGGTIADPPVFSQQAAPVAANPVAPKPVPPPPAANPKRVVPAVATRHTPVAPPVKVQPPIKSETKPATVNVAKSTPTPTPKVVPRPAPPPAVKFISKPSAAVVPEAKKQQRENKKPQPKVESKIAERKAELARMVAIRKAEPAKPVAEVSPKPAEVPPPAPKKVFSMPPGSLIASVRQPRTGAGPQIPTPPRVTSQPGREESPSNLPGSVLPAATPPKIAIASPTLVTTAAAAVSGAASAINSRDRDPLEGEWVYAPKEPERQRAGFYPPEFIDLKLFGSGDPGTLRGQYSARYVVSDRPVSPEVHFELASATKGSRRFLWQSSTGAKGTLNIDSIDDRTIRVDWHTTSAVRGPALTSGTATLVRR